MHAIIIINSDVNSEPRVIKQIFALEREGIVPIIISFSDKYDKYSCYQLPVVKKWTPSHLSYPTLLRKFISLLHIGYVQVNNYLNQQYYYDDRRVAAKVLREISKPSSSVLIVIAHHLKNLPIGYILSQKLNAKLIFNAHEFYPEQFSDLPHWSKTKRRLNLIGHKLLSKCDYIFNVSNGIINRYVNDFNLDIKKQILIRNSAPFHDLKPTKVNSNRIRLIHHGIANPNRKLELMLSIADKISTDRFEFYFMLTPSPAYSEYYMYLFNEIKARKNCYWIDPVPTLEIVKKINEFDIGFYIYNNQGNFNMKHYLPNKFFEFVQARLGVIIGPYVEMQGIVNEYRIGKVAPNNEIGTIVKLLEKLTVEEVYMFKKNTMVAATQLGSESDIEKMSTVFSIIKNVI